MNTENAIAIVKAIIKELQQVESSYKELEAQYHHYGATLDSTSIKNIEYPMILGAFLATEQSLKSMSSERYDFTFEPYHLKHQPPEGFEEIITEHFPLTRGIRVIAGTAPRNSRITSGACGGSKTV